VHLDSELFGVTEELDCLRVDSERFVLCCVPFFTWGLALGDEVTAERSGDVLRFTGLRSKSGRGVVRVDKRDGRANFASIAAVLLSAGVESEVQDEQRLVIDVAPGATALPLVDAQLDELEHLDYVDVWYDFPPGLVRGRDR
jgi:hypothetical protein